MKVPFHRSLHLIIFVAVWEVTVLTLLAGIGINYLLIKYEARSAPEMGRSLMLQASRALDAGGEAGLRQWLRSIPDDRQGSPVLVLDEHDQELLGRRLPDNLTIALGTADAGAGTDSPRPILPAHPLPVLVGHDGHHYAVYLRALHRPLVPPFFLQPVADRWLVIGFGLLLVLGASLILSSVIVRPVHAISRAAYAFSRGAWDTRVPEKISQRKDEIGVLAQDFNRMAVRLQCLIQSREQLLRDVSHELRSPLARMRVALGLARQPDSDRSIAYHRLDVEISRLDRLIGQVLELSRLDCAEAVPERVTLDLAEVLERIVGDAAFEAQGRRIAVEWHCEEPTLVVSGSPMWISSALENVVRNALQHSPDGAGITVTLRRDESDASIAVSDRGPGVAEEEIGRIFEPFYRAQTLRGGDRGGDGVGLAIVARVVQLHGGRAVAQNRPGGGLLIRLSLPLVSGAASRI